jgi:hypothetical protein
MFSSLQFVTLALSWIRMGDKQENQAHRRPVGWAEHSEAHAAFAVAVVQHVGTALRAFAHPTLA